MGGDTTEFPRGTVTFLFTDIEGSTRRWEVHGSAMARCISVHDELLRTAVEDNHGRVVKTTGDGLMAVFIRADDALAAALQGQRAVAAHDWAPIPSLRVRMGLHTGWCEPTGDDYFGSVVNRAARITDAGHGGQILLSTATNAVLGHHDDTEIVSRGEIRLKDLAEPVELFQVLAPGLQNELLTLRALAPDLADLPVQRTTFVGRTTETEQTIRALESHRLVTLVGPGGVGKTRLAVQVAGEVSQQFEAGVRFVDLAEVDDSDGVADAVLDQLYRRNPSVTRTGPVSDAMEGIIRHLGGSELLLLVDNCEHLARGAAVLVDGVLRNCPQVAVLATSRERLVVSGEQVVPVGPFPAPAPTERDAPAIRLFVERAIAAGVPPSAVDSLPLVSEIVELVDGLPLGIELAAARSLHLPLATLAERLREGPHRILRGDEPTRPDRHRTVEQLLRWSFDLLGADEQQLLTRLATFAGPVDLPAIEALCSDDRLVPERIVDLLGTLVDQSLVVFGQSTGQYRLLNVIRNFARDLLDRDARLVWQERHAAWCATSLQQSALEENDDALERFMATYGSEVHMALAWATDASRADLSWALAGASWRWYEITGRAREGLDIVERALAIGPPAETVEWASATSGAGSLAMVLGDVERARELQLAACRAFEHCGAEAEAASARIGLAMAMMLANDQRAESEARVALAGFESLGDRAGMAHACAALGLIAARAGRPADAKVHYLDALSHSRLGGRRRATASILSNLGNLSQDRGDHREASRFYDGALQLYREVGDHRGAGLILNNLCIVAQALGNGARAIELSRDAIREFNHIHDRQGVAAACHNLANLAMEAGDHEAAAGYYDRAIDGFRQARDPRGVIMAQTSARDLARRCGRAASAWRYDLDRTLVMHRLGLREPTRAALLGLATIAGDHGEQEVAELLHEAAGSMLADEIHRAISVARMAGFDDEHTPSAHAAVDEDGDGFAELTGRERELLAEVGSGKTNSEIADALFISRRTVDAHLSHIRTKLGVSDRSKLIVLARERLGTSTAPSGS